MASSEKGLAVLSDLLDTTVTRDGPIAYVSIGGMLIVIDGDTIYRWALHPAPPVTVTVRPAAALREKA